MAKAVPAINEPFVGLDGRITDVWYKYLLSLGYSKSNGGNGGSSDSNSLLKFEFDDHIRNNLSWLRADTFSWQDGEVYVGVYEHLLEDIEGKELQSETIGGITIQYYLADDKHKICPATEEIPIMNLYNNIGIAWYYIIDTDNKFFKLPRNKWGFVGLRDEVGKYVEPEAPNVKGTGRGVGASTSVWTGAFKYLNSPANSGHSSVNESYANFNFDLSRVSSIYKNNGTIQQAGIQCYLYFYVGDADGDDVRKIASANLEKLNSKADTNLLNTDNNVDFIIDSQEPTAENNYTWYNLYRSGRVEQGGYINAINNNIMTINLLIEMRDVYYNPVISRSCDTNPGGTGINTQWNSSWEKTTTNFKCWEKWGVSTSFSWKVEGKADLT